jgi:uncharacterized membrane protein
VSNPSNPCANKNMNNIKKTLGIVWMLLGLATAYFGIFILGIPKFTSGKQEDLVFGIIIMLVLTPIVTGGLFIFGKYAWDGEYGD